MTEKKAQVTIETYKHFDKMAYDDDMHELHNLVIMRYREAKTFLAGLELGRAELAEYARSADARARPLVEALEKYGKCQCENSAQSRSIYRCGYCEALEAYSQRTEGERSATDKGAAKLGGKI